MKTPKQSSTKGKQPPGIYTTRLHVRVTPQEKAEIQQRAAQAGLTVSDYVRKILLAE